MTQDAGADMPHFSTTGDQRRLRRAVARSAASLTAFVAVLTLCGCRGGVPLEQPATPYALPASATPLSGPTRPVTGIETTPSATRVDAARVLGPIPRTPFPAWDGHSVVLYNLKTGEHIDLGPGRVWIASFDSTGAKFAWLAGASAAAPGTQPPTSGLARVIDLSTRVQRDYGAATVVTFADTGHLLAQRPTTGFQRVDLITGEDSEPTFAGSPLRVHYPGYLIAAEARPPERGDNAPYVVVPDDGAMAIRLNAAVVLPMAGHQNEVLALARAQGTVYHLFRIDVDDARATFIASADFDGYDYPVGGAGRVLAVGDRLCHSDGRILVYDFDTARLVALRTNFAPVQLTTSGFGIDGGDTMARARLDPATLYFGGVLPAPGVWSPDGVWAAVGPPAQALPANPCPSATATPNPTP